MRELIGSRVASQRLSAPGLATKGPLKPAMPAASVERAELSERFADVARQVWVPRWSIPAGQTMLQPVLQYPAVNIVVEPDSAALYLPADGVAERGLTGTSWAAGLLMRPGAGSLVVPGDHSTMLGAVMSVPSSDSLISRLRDTIPAGGPTDSVVAYETWLEPLLDRVDDDVRLLNAIADAAEQDATVNSTRDLVDRFGISERSLQRLFRRRVGLSPRWLIQRRRLQEAAFRLRENLDTGLAELAAELGYADQSHFTRDFRKVVGQTPGTYRRALSGSGQRAY